MEVGIEMTTNIDWLAVARKAAEDTLAAVAGLEAALAPVEVKVSSLPNEDGYYVGEHYPVPEYDPYVLKEGIWYEANDEGWTVVEHPEDYAPFTRLVPEADTAKKVIDEILNWAIRNEAGRDEAHYIVWEKSLHRIAAEFGVTL